MRLLATTLLALAGTALGKYFAKTGYSDSSCKHAVSAAYYLTDACSLDGAQYSKTICSGTSAQKQFFTTSDCSGEPDSVVALDFPDCELDNGVYYSAACGDFSDSAIRSTLQDEAAFVYEYAQSSGAESKCKTSGQPATAVKGYKINHCFNDDGNYIYKCTHLSFTKTTFADAQCESTGDISGSAQAQMTTCASSADVPVAGANAGAWVSVLCQAKDFFIAENNDGDDDNWVTDTSTGRGLVAASVLLGVLCVVLAIVIWKYNDQLAKAPKREEEDSRL